MRIFTFSFLCLFTCSVNQTIPKINSDQLKTLQLFENLNVSNILEITNDSEPGKKLLLCVTILKKEDMTPLKNQDVLFFQTNNEGDYEPEIVGDESSARLNGTTKTDENGRLFIKTILPGDYGTTAGNRHIHTTITLAKPKAYDIFFKQYINQGMLDFIETSDQHFLANLVCKEDGVLVGFITLLPKNIN